MKLTIKKTSLFDVNDYNPEPYALAHCISSDFGMGAGIVVMFNRLYGMKYTLRTKYGTLDHKWTGQGYVLPEKVSGCRNDDIKINDCTEKVYNLVTKQYVYEKPTYDTLRTALEKLRDTMLEAGEKKLAIPLIGCGIDGLVWDKVEPLLMEIFNDTDVEILVCYLEKDKSLLGNSLMEGF